MMPSLPSQRSQSQSHTSRPSVLIDPGSPRTSTSNTDCDSSTEHDSNTPPHSQRGRPAAGASAAGVAVMPYEASFMSSNTITQSIKRIATNRRPEVAITFDANNTGSHTYTTGDSLSGKVSIASFSTVRFDEVHITLEGVSTTFIELMSPVAHQTRQQCLHPFLKLTMPIPDSAYPVPRLAEAGMAYTFSFNFVIPPHLLLSTCTHKTQVDENHVRAAHLRLPPSIGGNQSPKNDLSPDMARIEYGIRVRVVKSAERGSENRVVTLVDKKRQIRVIPAIPEAPPLHLEPNDEEYNLTVSKPLKKGVFKGKLGNISLSAPQTKAITTPLYSTDSSPTIIATLNLRFDPSNSTARPPRLGSLTSKIQAATYFAIRGQVDLPTRPKTLSPYEITRRVYTETVSIGNRCMEAVEWTHHPAGHGTAQTNLAPSYAQSQRRDSGYSTASNASTAPSLSSQGSTIMALEDDRAHAHASAYGYWSAKMHIPLTLPAGKTWLPTFHTCTVSRIYILDMAIVAHTPGTGVPSTTLGVRMPLELVTVGDDNNGTRRGSTVGRAAAEGGVVEGMEGLSLEEEIERDFVPRTLEVMREEWVGRSGSIVSIGGGVSGVPGVPAGVAEVARRMSEGVGVGEGGGAAAAAVERREEEESELPPGYEVFGRGVTVRY